jgi:hypothetical protein
MQVKNDAKNQIQALENTFIFRTLCVCVCVCQSDGVLILKHEPRISLIQSRNDNDSILTFHFLCFVLSLRFIFFPSLDPSFLALFPLTFIYFSSFNIFVSSIQFICFFLSFYWYLIFILLIFVFHYFFTLCEFFPFLDFRLFRRFITLY